MLDSRRSSLALEALDTYAVAQVLAHDNSNPTKPALAVISTLPLVPSTWRAAIVMFTQALDALSSIGSDITLEFKAGKDLEA